jgi:hypothetical protein
MKTDRQIVKKLALSDKLTKECMRVLNLTIDEGGCVINDGDIMEWHDLESVSLFNPIPYENDRIDGVLFFGDGTIEFHLENDGDALNWAEFSNDYIKMIIEELENNQCSKFA